MTRKKLAPAAAYGGLFAFLPAGKALEGLTASIFIKPGGLANETQRSAALPVGSRSLGGRGPLPISPQVASPSRLSYRVV
jgi:hypothetical protein